MMGVNSDFINRHFANQYGLDIETTGSSVESDRVLQIGIQTPGGRSFEINVKQDNYKPSKFHARPGGLHGYYEANKIDPQSEATFRQMLDKEKRYYSTVVNKERAKVITQNLLQPGNKAANIISHNANFEIKHLNSFYDGASPFQYSSEYRELINRNALSRLDDESLFKAGKLSVAEYRARDIARQTAIYDQIVVDAQKGGAIIDSMEIAKTANALAQKRGLVPVTGDLALGTNVEMLSEVFLNEKEVHRAVQDVWQQNQITPRLVTLVEKLKRDDFKPTMLNAQEKAWADVFNKNHVKLKVDAQTKAIKQAIDNLAEGRPHRFRSGKLVTNDIDHFIDYLGQTGTYAPVQISQGIRPVSHGVAPSEIVKKAVANLDDEYKGLLGELRGASPASKLPSTIGASKTAKVVLGAMALVGVVGITKKLLSSKDDDHNTIEGLKHGWFGSQRNENSDFGSGYKGPSKAVVAANPLNNQTTPTDPQDQTPNHYWMLGGAAGLYGGYKASHLLKSGKSIDSLSYFGPAPKGFESWSEFLGRSEATYGDLLYNATRRVEYSMGGFPKAFSVSTVMSSDVLRSASYSVDLTAKGSVGYHDYLSKLTGVNLLQEGITGVEVRGGKLFASQGKQTGRVLLEEARLYQAIHDKNITGSQAQFAKSMESIVDSKGIGSKFEFLIGGGNSKLKASMNEMHAYAHESFSKYLRLVDDPAKAARELLPNMSEGLTNAIAKGSKFLPKMGVGGEANLIGSLPQLIARHAKTALPLLIGIPLAYKTIDWLARQSAPDDTTVGRAGVTGLGAEIVRNAHMTYAHLSDFSGLTSLRKSAEEQAPGMTGILPFTGMALSFGLTGAVAGAAAGMAVELGAANKYATMLANKSAIHELPKIFSKIPGFGGKYTLAGKYGRMGAILGGTLALPMLFAGLGSKKSADELNDEYLNGKEVAVKKGRWWEFGMTPFEGSKTSYYRPNWYNRLFSQAERKSMYGDDDISPIGEMARTIVDPYWKEKLHYDDRPYPVATSSGENLGIFSVAYERTIGQVLKPTAFMHAEGMAPGTDWSSVGMGSKSGEEAMSPTSAKEDIKQQYYNTYEALGLRGFVLSSMRQAMTGERDIADATPVMQSSSDMDSINDKFWDLNLGGGLGLTEPLRRFMPNKSFTTEKVNTITNTMPSWMPGANYYTDFKTGDPYGKVPEGEYRLPGAGYAARYEDLKGLNPEDYPLIHKYKILADVAMESKEFRGVARQVESANLSEEDQRIYEETKAQLEDKRQKRKFLYDEQYQGVFGKYTKAVASIAQGNPLEQLTPFSPAHKFLPKTDPLQQYEEMVFGKEFKQWQNPVDDFIKPFLYSTGNLIGVDKIPPQVEEVRKIEQYFDELKYAKFKKLQGTAEGNYMQNKSLLGSDPYNPEFNTFLLPKRERDFFDAFKEMPMNDKQKALQIAPDNLKDIYQAQWDMDLMRKMEAGEIAASESEKAQVAQAVQNRRDEISARRDIRRREVLTNPQLPKDDWIGWNPNVDLDDVKLKYLMNNSKEFHYYDLWDDRARKLRTKPIIGQAASGIDPLSDAPQNNRMSKAEMLQWANNSGLDDVTISSGSGVNEGVTVKAEYDSRHEENKHVRDLGYVI